MATIMIVDDEEPTRITLFAAFSNKYKIIQAANGQEGLQVFLQHKPDLIITDQNMPVMNGFDMVSGIRASDKKVKIIAFSGSYDYGLEKMLEAGA
ncbi:MAG: response regulator, partial [Acidobacteriota bacterium]